MTRILDDINSPVDLKELDFKKLTQLAVEIREQILQTVAVNGGHLAPSLGVVELTLALHWVFNSPEDKIIWDVGHQCYAHKIITGRRDDFQDLRRLGGISGFPSIFESDHDAFGTGHSSTSISAALGMALARDVKKEDHSVVAVIGDGAMTGGMAFEALNHAGHLRRNLIVILNDNEMSISRNVGALAGYLSRLRIHPKYYKNKKGAEQLLRSIPGAGNALVDCLVRLKRSLKSLVVTDMFFEDLGFTYLGPVDGHNVPEMVNILQQARLMGGPVLVHVLTRKGCGYPPAEVRADKYHGIGPFDVETGESGPAARSRQTYTSVFGLTMVELAKDDDSIVAISAAMPSGTGLSKFASTFPERFFDVGIAEQHAVTLAAGLVLGGELKPVVAIYSTFLQRAYDQIVHDVCLQKLSVTFAIDRAGLVGEDGPTHHGAFDFAYLRHMPNMVVMAPKDENELRMMLKTAVTYPGPAALRYPRGAGRGCGWEGSPSAMPVGRAEVLSEGKDILLLAVGSMVEICEQAADQLCERGIDAALINARFVKPLDEATILKHVMRTGRVITVEEHALQGGFGSAVLELLAQAGVNNVHVKMMGIPDAFIPFGKRSELLAYCGLTVGDVVRNAELLLGEWDRNKKFVVGV